MIIKNIVNKEVVTITNCESEPIHIPGSIQSHGFLIAVKKDTLTVGYVSDNIEEYTGSSPKNILGKAIHDFFTPEEHAFFTEYIAKLSANADTPFVYTNRDTPFNTTVHQSGDYLILEFEPFPDGNLNTSDLYIQTKKFVSLIHETDNLKDLCQTIAVETRAITGYDRVMIYRFDKDYNGEVFSESKRDDLDPFLGHHYPHTDIPIQARELYLRNLMRVIADVAFQPVPILTIDEGEAIDKTLDLSLSVLRSVSPIHIQYLKNMGVKATLTISLIENKKLWGLIACHHYSPKVIPYYTRLSALLQGQFLTSQITVRENADEYSIAKSVEESLNELLQMMNEDDYIAGILKGTALLSLTNADGVAIVKGDKVYTKGEVPPEKDITDLATYLSEHVKEGKVSTSKLIDIYPAADNLKGCCAGIIYHSLVHNTNECIIWFRPEIEKHKNWAGNPTKAVIVQDDSPNHRLWPRTSFELWREEVRNQSEDWRKPELNVATSFATTLQKQIYISYITEEEERSRNIAEQLKLANEELSNFNWISTHDLKEPLRKIQVFSSKLLDTSKYELQDAVVENIKRINLSAVRMQTLLDDILQYSQTANDKSHFELTDLNAVYNDVRGELNDDLIGGNIMMTAEALPVITAIPFQLHQLFFNLLSNAIKFSSDSNTAEIKIMYSHADRNDDVNIANASTDQKYHRITIRDNGIGFDPQYSKKIFNIFQRLHDREKYDGTGIGLAICKKIMENHYGIIAAESEKDKGASFHLYFPVS